MRQAGSTPLGRFSRIAEIPCHRVPDDEWPYSVDTSAIDSGAYTVMITFDACVYPLEQHCRYVRHGNPALPYTFPNMEFGETHQGLRVGPWPGWRGIPPMPEAMIAGGKDQQPVGFQFWGDEFQEKHLRGVATLEIGLSGGLRISVRDGRLVPLKAEIFPAHRHSANQRPVALRQSLVGRYPRLLLTDSDVVSCRARLNTTHSSHWERIVKAIQNWDLPFLKSPESKSVEGPERLSGEDRILLSTFRALMMPTDNNIAAAKQSFFDFAEETRRNDFEPLTIDTQSGEVLFVMCLAYDWLHGFLSSTEIHKGEERLREVAEICWAHLGYERRDFGQAHFLGCGLGLFAFSFLFWESHPRAQEWASYLRGALDRILAILPSDGFFPHGINLWIYEYGFLLRWIELLRTCTGENLWKDFPHWEHASGFRCAATSPDGLYGVTSGDPQYRVGGDSWCHYLITARTGSRNAQWLGDFLLDGPHAGVDYRHIPPRRRVYEFLYHDQEVVSEKPHASVHAFCDGGQVFVKNEGEIPSLFTFRSGPPLGNQRYMEGERGAYGHSDPANGSFLLFRNNELAVSGPGPTYRRETALHNTLTVDGQGQIGDTAVWLPDFIPPGFLPPATTLKTDGRRVSLFADLTRAYLPHLRVRSCLRSCYIDLDTLIAGIDTIESDDEHQLEWNLHSWSKFTHVTGESELSFNFGASGAKNVAMMFLPAHCQWQTGITEMVPAYPHDGRRDHYLRISQRGMKMQFVWCIILNDDIHPRLETTPAGLTLADVGDAPIHFDGRWLIPKGFNEIAAQ